MAERLANWIAATAPELAQNREAAAIFLKNGEAPRWLSGRFALGESRDLLNVEGRYPEATLQEPERRGHVLNRWGAWNELAGHAHGITVDPVTGARWGGSDPRSDGAAIGY